MAKMMWLDY